MFIGFFNINDCTKSKVNKIYLKQAKIIQDVKFIYYPKN